MQSHTCDVAWLYLHCMAHGVAPYGLHLHTRRILRARVGGSRFVMPLRFSEMLSPSIAASSMCMALTSGCFFSSVQHKQRPCLAQHSSIGCGSALVCRAQSLPHDGELSSRFSNVYLHTLIGNLNKRGSDGRVPSVLCSTSGKRPFCFQGVGLPCWPPQLPIGV